jgi:FkbM family methyltransferase
VLLTNFSGLMNTASANYSIANSRRPHALLNQRSRAYLLQQGTGILMEDFYFQLINELGVKQIIECGAHDAATSRRFMALTSGNAIAFEANPAVYEKYRELNSAARVDYRNLGLYDEKSSLNLNIPAHHVDATSLESSLEKREDFQDYRQVQIQVDTLDNVALDYIREYNTAIWIDVEGLGHKVLTGASKLLSSPQATIIYIEVQEEKLHYKNEKYAFEIAEYLGQFGFVAIARDYPVAPLFNLIFVREGDLGSLLPLISKFWLSYSELKVPFMRFYHPRDIASVVKRRIVSSRFHQINFILDLLFSKLGSKSSKQRVSIYFSKPKG